MKQALYKNNAPVLYLFVLRRLARKCTKIYNACRTFVRLIKLFLLRQLIKSRFAAVVVCIRTMLLWCIKSHDVDISVFCLRFKPRNHWKTPSEQSCLACRFPHWKSLYHSFMEISRNWHQNFSLIEWKAPLGKMQLGKCSSTRQFAEVQAKIFHRMKSAIDFSLHGACFLNCFSHYHLVTLISI